MKILDSVWDDCVEESKEELEIEGWVEKDTWNKVIDLAKEKYWSSGRWNELREMTLKYYNYQCILCHNKQSLRVHHVIHSLQKKYGFIVQGLLAELSGDFKLPNEFRYQSVVVNVLKKLLRGNNDKRQGGSK